MSEAYECSLFPSFGLACSRGAQTTDFMRCQYPDTPATGLSFRRRNGRSHGYGEDVQSGPSWRIAVYYGVGSLRRMRGLLRLTRPSQARRVRNTTRELRVRLATRFSRHADETERSCAPAREIGCRRGQWSTPTEQKAILHKQNEVLPHPQRVLRAEMAFADRSGR
jgi:hypothetical protein